MLVAILISAVIGADAPTEVKNMMDRHNVGMVATIYVDKNKPYNSIMPFALDKKNRPFVFISELAVHTQNIEKNPNISLMVFEPDKNGNVFNGARAIFDGKFKKTTDKNEIAELKKIYLKKHPDAEIFIEFEDFSFYVLEIDSIYYIGGFGDIGHINVQKYMNVKN